MHVAKPGVDERLEAGRVRRRVQVTGHHERAIDRASPRREHDELSSPQRRVGPVHRRQRVHAEDAHGGALERDRRVDHRHPFEVDELGAEQR